MSETTKVVKAPKTLWERIAAFLKLDDAGKIQAFLAREIKKANRAITALEANIKSIKVQYKITKVDLEEQIEDAEAAVQDAYMAVDITKISNNKQSDDFADVYWTEINRANESLKILNKKLEDFELAHKGELEDVKKQIKRWEERISNIS